MRELGVWVFAQVRDNGRSGDERSEVFGTDFGIGLTESAGGENVGGKRK